MRLYGELARHWQLVSAVDDYAEEAEVYGDLLRAHAAPPPATLLELGSGGGNNAFFLKRSFALVLTDLSPAMLEQSRRQNPECEHVAGDMRTLRLHKTFDAVLAHDAIGYMATRADLRAAMATAFAHLRPRGAALFAPDHVLETWSPSSEVHGGDAPDGTSLRYLEWCHDPDPADETFVVDYAIAVRECGTTRVVHDQHVLGLFARATWCELLAEAGFEVSVVRDRWGRDLFVGRRPG
jgi:SAM-dependent methyltransferase